MKKTKNLAGRSAMGLVMFRFRKNKLAIIGLIILGIMILSILAAPLFVSYDKVIRQNFQNRFATPNSRNLFGTDEYGRDLFARILYGGRISLFGGLGVVALTFVIGIFLGGIAGYFGAKTDTIVMRIVDIFMAIPPTLLSMAIVTALGHGVDRLIIAVAIGMAPRFARIVRASILNLRNMEYIEAARCYGASSIRIISKHVLPNGMGPIIVAATLTLGQAIISISAMGFLGLGVASPTPEWGTILSESKIHIRSFPHLGIIPGICIGLAVMSVNFIGDGLRDAFDPRTKN